MDWLEISFLEVQTLKLLVCLYYIDGIFLSGRIVKRTWKNLRKSWTFFILMLCLLVNIVKKKI